MTMSSSETANEPVQQVSKEITLKIKLPKSISDTQEILEFPSSLGDSLSELKQPLNIIPITRNLSNYDIFLGKVNIGEQFDYITSYAEILNELGKDLEIEELELTLKDKPYNLAAVYEHLARFRQVIGLHYIDRKSQDFGVSDGASKLNSIGLTKVKEEPTEVEEKVEERVEDPVKDETEKKEDAEEIKISEDELKVVAEVANEINVEDKISNIVSFDRIGDLSKIPIKSLTISQWSPVSPSQKTKGDLLYLTLQTLESEIFNITCHYSGFFVNKSSTANFNPEIKTNEKGKFFKNYLLYNLVASLSPAFTKSMEENEVILSTATDHPESYLLPNNSFLASPWIVDTQSMKIQPDLSRIQLPLFTNGVDGSDYVKDWNDDIQALRELPSESIQEKILKEKLVQKTLFDFTKVATQTAIHIINGNLTSMNPTEETSKQIFLKNGIFYTSEATSLDIFEETGGIDASRYASSKDLAAIKILNKFDVHDVHSLVTCIVDYMGKRIVCQAPVPGIFSNGTEGEEEEEEKVLYGLSSTNTKILRDESFNDSLQKVADVFHLKAHSVEISDSVKSDGKLIVSKDSKGIRGTDGRKYIIELYRTTPRDVEFTEANFDLSKEDTYPHGESLLRHEAVEEWWKRKASVLFKAETERLEKEGKDVEGENGEKPQIVLPTDQIVFNPDAFSGINESDEDRDVVRNMSKFIKDNLVEEFLAEFPSQVAPFDGASLTDSLHRQGINMRYLGYIAEQALSKKEQIVKTTEATMKANEEEVKKRKAEEDAKKEEEKAKSEANSEVAKSEEDKAETEEKPKEESKATFESAVANFDVLYSLCVQEMIARSVKHLLGNLSSKVPGFLVPEFVAHFHNCLLGSQITTTPEAMIDETQKLFLDDEALEFVNLTSEEVFKLIKSEVRSRFRYSLPEGWVADLVKPNQLLREIAHKFGIQWTAQEYAFTAEVFATIKDKSAVEQQVIETKSKKNKKKSQQTVVATKTIERSSTFLASDIVNFLPVVKDSGYKATLIDEILQTARAHIMQGDKEVGTTLLNDLLSIQEQIYGLVNPETAKLYTLVSQIYADLGHEYKAALIARKAIILSERTTGFDSFDTVTAYMNSGYYSSSNMELGNSLKLYKQAIDIWSSVYGKNHPTLITTLINLGESLTRVSLFPSAFKVYEDALSLSIEVNGAVSELTGSIYYKLGMLLLNSSRFKEARDIYAIAQDIFTKLLGPDDMLSTQAATYADSIGKYLQYAQAQEQEKQQAAKQAAKQASNGKKAKSPPAPPAKKNSKKATQSNPDIASKSVDDILKFIEGNGPKKSKKNGKK